MRSTGRRMMVNAARKGNVVSRGEGKRILRAGDDYRSIVVNDAKEIKDKAMDGSRAMGVSSMKANEIAKAMHDLDFRHQGSSSSQPTGKTKLIHPGRERSAGRASLEMVQQQERSAAVGGTSHRSKMRLLSEQLDSIGTTRTKEELMDESRYRSVRHVRMQDTLRNGIEELFRKEDLPQFRFLRKYGMAIGIGQVKVSSDLKHAVVYWLPPLSFEADVTSMNKFSFAEPGSISIDKQKFLNEKREVRKRQYLDDVDKFLTRNRQMIRELSGRYVGLWHMPNLEFKPYSKSKQGIDQILTDLSLKLSPTTDTSRTDKE